MNNTLYVVKVKEMKKCYTPNFLHFGIGYCISHDKDHVYFKFIRGISCGCNLDIVGPYRYCWEDITITTFLSEENISVPDCYITRR